MAAVADVRDLLPEFVPGVPNVCRQYATYAGVWALTFCALGPAAMASLTQPSVQTVAKFTGVALGARNASATVAAVYVTVVTVDGRSYVYVGSTARRAATASEALEKRFKDRMSVARREGACDGLAVQAISVRARSVAGRGRRPHRLLRRPAARRRRPARRPAHGRPHPRERARGEAARC